MKNLSTAPQILSLSALELFAVEASVSEDLSDPTVLRQLESLGVNATVRRRLGTDISAACGQLRREDAQQAENC